MLYNIIDYKHLLVFIINDNLLYYILRQEIWSIYIAYRNHKFTRKYISF